jgi:uncharacterized protein (TIGR02217 family)
MAFHDVRLPEQIERGSTGGPRFKTTVVTLASGHEFRNGDWERTRGKWDAGYGIQNTDDLFDVVNFFYAREGRLNAFRFKDWTDFRLDNNIATGDDTTTVFQLVKLYESGSFQYQRRITRPVAGTITASATVNLVGTTTYQWTLSGSGTGEYYLEAQGGGQPPLSNQPPQVHIGGSSAPTGTVGSLVQGEWDWADNDSLGFSTIYVRLSGDADPDTSGSGNVQAVYPDSDVTKDPDTGQLTFGTAPAEGAIVTAECEFDVPVRFDTDELDIQAEAYLGGDGSSGVIPDIPLVEIRE